MTSPVASVTRGRRSRAEPRLHAANRVRLERILLEPGKYRFARISQRDLGEPGCGVWQVRPRLGLIGMLMGWWQVKLSSGCPLGRVAACDAAARAASRLLAERQQMIERRRGLTWTWEPLDMRQSLMTDVREPLRTGAGAALVVLIMFIGSLVLWVGTPLLWLWLGSQIQGATDSLGAALLAMFFGVIASITLLAILLSKLSNVYRANCRARGLDDPGHFVLEGVLVVSAGLTVAVFVVWFFFFAGASPIPIGINV